MAPREWLLSGGNGFEDGEDGLRAVTFTGEGVIELLEAYHEYLHDAGEASDAVECDSPRQQPKRSWDTPEPKELRGVKGQMKLKGDSTK